MKNMKYRLTFGIALACVMLFTACDTSIDPPAIQPPIESGYGSISISFAGETSARTALPPTVFDKYVYTFTKAGEQSGVVKTSDNNGFFILEIGSYTVAVQAYIGNAEPYALAASGVSSAFSVGSGNNDPVIVYLSAVTVEAQGEFSYTITYPAGAEAAVTLQKWPDMSNITLTPHNLTQGEGISETLALESGSYLLTVLMSKDGLYAGISEAVHIRPSLATVYAKDFNDNDFNTRGPGAAVSAPTLNVVSPDSITLNPASPPINGQIVEYGINTVNTAPSAWQTGVTFSGLDAGTTYYIFARAKENNNFHTGAVSTSLPVTTLNVPGAPQNFTAIPDNQQVSLSWSAPSSNGGSAIIRYEVSSNNGSTWITASANTSHTFTGLTNGTSYTFQVRAVNNTGNGVTASATATPRTTPAAPHNVTATAGDRQITLAWIESNDGGSPVIRYEVSSNNGSTWITATANTGHTVTGLTNGTSYTFQVRAVNAAGNSAAVSVNGTPMTVPTEPRYPSINPGSGQASLLWSVPGSNGGSAIIRYEVSSDNGSSWITVTGGNSHTFTGLTNGQEYTFCVRAVNAAGNGAIASITVTVYAYYTVTYNGNGATSGTVPATQTVIVGTSITLPGQGTLLRSGYVFGGWNTYSSGTGTNYNANSSFTPTGDITLYGKWDYNTAVPPRAPYNIERDDVINSTSITLYWDAVSNATGYTVYRSSSASGPYTSVGTTSSTSYTYSVSTSYYYKVSASNSYGEGLLSEESVWATTGGLAANIRARYYSELVPSYWIEFGSGNTYTEGDERYGSAPSYTGTYTVTANRYSGTCGEPGDWVAFYIIDPDTILLLENGWIFRRQ